MFPETINELFSAHVSLKRIHAFLQCPEVSGLPSSTYGTAPYTPSSTYGVAATASPTTATTTTTTAAATTAAATTTAATTTAAATTITGTKNTFLSSDNYKHSAGHQTNTYSSHATQSGRSYSGAVLQTAPGCIELRNASFTWSSPPSSSSSSSSISKSTSTFISSPLTFCPSSYVGVCLKFARAICGACKDRDRDRDRAKTGYTRLRGGRKSVPGFDSDRNKKESTKSMFTFFDFLGFDRRKHYAARGFESEEISLSLQVKELKEDLFVLSDVVMCISAHTTLIGLTRKINKDVHHQ